MNEIAVNNLTQRSGKRLCLSYRLKIPGFQLRRKVFWRVQEQSKAYPIAGDRGFQGRLRHNLSTGKGPHRTDVRLPLFL